MGSNRICIISSSVIICEGLKSVIQQLTNNQIIEEYSSWSEFLIGFDKKLTNQIILVEVKSLPEKEKLKSLKHVVNNNVTPILFYYNENEIHNFQDYVTIPINISRENLSKKLSDFLSSADIKEPNANVLSERETTILKEVALGLTNKEISDKLYISMHTVITHRKNITAKLGIKTISGLTVYAIINNIISTGDINS